MPRHNNRRPMNGWVPRHRGWSEPRSTELIAKKLGIPMVNPDATDVQQREFLNLRRGSARIKATL